MGRAPIVAGTLVMASAIFWSLLAVFPPTDVDQGSASLVAIDLLVASVVAAAGIAISRSVWARRLAVGLVAVPPAVLLVVPVRLATLSAAAVSVAALVSLVGPWLTPYIGSLPRSDAPPPRAVLLALLLLLQPGWIGVVSWAGLTLGLWALAGGCFLLAWAYGRALSPSLLILRFAYLPAGLLAVLGSPFGVAVAVVLYSAAATGLAWTAEARLAVKPPQPVPGTAVPIPLRHLPRQVRSQIRNEQ